MTAHADESATAPCPAPDRVRISASGLTRAAGRRYILRDVSFTASGGEVVALVGRNGAGKTTLLSLLAGRLAPDRGRVAVIVSGREAGRREAAAFVGFLPHDLFVYPDLTARENLEFSATLHGVRDPRARAAEVLDRIGLGREADRPVRTFSRGMQQRAAIGRLLVVAASVWLLDEPTTGLDEPGRRWLAAVIRSQAEAGTLVVMASHHRVEVEEWASRALVLEAGRLVLDLPGGPDGAARAFARVEAG